MKRNDKIIAVAQGAMIAAIYAAATYASSALGIAYGQVQFRFSEALTALAVLTPAAVPGLTVGCIIGNIGSPMGVWDIIFGSLATLLASLSARALRRVRFKGIPLLSIIMPVIFNALIVGAEIALLTPTDGAKITLFAISALEVGAGELTVCLAGGIPVYLALRNKNIPRFDK